MNDGRYSIPGKRAVSVERDEQIGQLMAAVARLEKGQRTLEDIDRRTADYPQLAQKLRDFIAVGAWFKPFGVVAVMGVLGFVASQLEQRTEVKQLKEQVSTLSNDQALLKAKLDTLDTNLRAVMSGVDRLEKSLAECAEQNKRAPEKERKRR